MGFRVQTDAAAVKLAERDGIALAIVERLERACGAKGMPPTLVRREFLPERPCVAHLPSDDTEGGSHD